MLKVVDILMWESLDFVFRGELLIGVRGVNVLLCISFDYIDKDVINFVGKFLNFIFK